MVSIPFSSSRRNWLSIHGAKKLPITLSFFVPEDRHQRTMEGQILNDFGRSG